MDYENAYKELKDFVLTLNPYCDTCSGDYCEDCYRKNINWTINPKLIEGLEEKHNIITK